MLLPGGVLQESRWDRPGARAVLATCLGENLGREQPHRLAMRQAFRGGFSVGIPHNWTSSGCLCLPGHTALGGFVQWPWSLFQLKQPGSQTSSTLALVAGSIDACLFCPRRRELLACLGGGPGLTVWSHSILPADARCSEQVSSGTKTKLCES